jgi:isochorismate pyruvate lyase
LGERLEYVKAASRFKTTEEGVRAPDRLRSMLETRRHWAEAAGLSPTAIGAMYPGLVAYFTQAELEHWREQASEHGPG